MLSGSEFKLCFDLTVTLGVGSFTENVIPEFIDECDLFRAGQRGDGGVSVENHGINMVRNGFGCNADKFQRTNRNSLVLRRA